MTDIEEIKKEYETILEKLSNPELISDWPARRASQGEAGGEKFEALINRKVRLEKIIAKAEEIQEIKNKIEENKAILTDKEDRELFSLAEEELVSLKEREKILEKELKELIKIRETKESERDEKNNDKNSSVIVEIRAGTGGEEAALFAADLFRMYLKYAETQNWKQKILDSRPSEVGGFKEIIFELKNGDVFSKMKYEGGVHRVQRIPITEKSGRVHTSTATVAVLPKPKKTEIKINTQDLKIDFYRASGPGGQYVNRRETAVRITHLPTNIVVTSQTERNQLQNKENALSILGARILEKRQMAEEEKISGKRKAQIGWAKRAEKIRTYNFPQNRVTDHRIKKSWHDIEKTMDGRLEKIILTLQKSELG